MQLVFPEVLAQASKSLRLEFGDEAEWPTICGVVFLVPAVLLDLLGLWQLQYTAVKHLDMFDVKIAECSLPFRCNTCKKRMPIFAQFIGAQGKHMCFTEALGSVENNLHGALWYILIQRLLWYLTPYDSRQSHPKTHDTWQRECNHRY